PGSVPRVGEERRQHLHHAADQAVGHLAVVQYDQAAAIGGQGGLSRSPDTGISRPTFCTGTGSVASRHQWYAVVTWPCVRPLCKIHITILLYRTHVCYLIMQAE